MLFNSLWVPAAMQLKPDEGTPDLPEGQVRVRLDTDGSVHNMNPADLDQCEDLSELHSVNECGVLHTLTCRAKAHNPLTHAGPNLMCMWPPQALPGKVSSLVGVISVQVYISMVAKRRDQSVVAIGRSGTGKTTSSQAFAHELLKHAGTAGEKRLQAVFTVLRSFGCVSSAHSEASSRFAMVLSLDFNHAGQAAAGHLQTLMLEKWRVCHKPEGESNFLVFSQMLAGLSAEMRTELQLHQQAEANTFGIIAPTKVEERQRASVGFGRLVAAMDTLAISANEQRAIWHVLAGIYHLGVAGACKVGRKQFMSFDSAQVASRMLGCEGEELHTAVFKHHLRQLLQRATGGARERHAADNPEEGPKLSASQCVEGMASGLYEELFTAVVSLINRALCSQHLTLASVLVVDTPGLRNPRHNGEERAAAFPELCSNYLQERLLEHYFTHTFTHTLDRYKQEKVSVDFVSPESSPSEVVSAIDQPGLQVRAAEGDPRGLLWVLDEELMTPGSTESTVLERVCRYFGNTGLHIHLLLSAVRQCEQPLQCEISHQMGSDPIRYDLSGWFSLVQNNPSALNAISILHNSSIAVVKALFSPRASLPPLCRGLGGVEGGSQRSLERSSIIRKTFSAGLAAIRRHSHCISVKLQACKMNKNLIIHVPTLHCFSRSLSLQDALINLIRRASPVFLQCISAKTNAGALDVPAIRIQMHSTHILSALQLYRAGYPEHMTLSEFRCRFQALSPPVMKRYGSVFITPDERKAVEELLPDLDLEKKSIVVGASRVFMKRNVLKYLNEQRDKLVSGWLVLMQASCLGHLARQRYRRLKVRDMAVRCIQRNLRSLTEVRSWSWWRLLCKVRPLLDVNIDDLKFRAKEVEGLISALRRRLEKSEKDRNELRQSADDLETKATMSSELSDERFRGDAVNQALDVERTERLRLSKENKELQTPWDLWSTLLLTILGFAQYGLLYPVCEELEIQMQLECAQTEVEFLRRRLRQTEERLEAERQTREQLDSKLEQSKRSVSDLKRQSRRVTSDLQDARVLTDSLQGRIHELERKQRRYVFQPTTVAVVAQLPLNARFCVVLCCEGLSVVSCYHFGPQWAFCSCLQMHLRCEMEMERMKQIHQKELEDKDEELEDMQKSSQRRLRQLEMQLEQEYEEKQMVVHEKHDLEGLIATLCDQVGHRDFDVEKKLRRDLKRTHALLSDAQLLLSTVDVPGQGLASGAKEQLERLHCQLEESEARRLEVENSQKTLALELENAQLELENICKHKSLVDEQLAHLQHEKSDLLKRLEEDQEDLNELMKKHKALIAQSSSDISQIRELQADLEETKKQRQALQEELQRSVTRVQFLESTTVARSIVSKQEARVCDLENKLEFQRGQVKRFEVLVLRLRDSVVRLGEELEQAAQAEARERESSQYYQQRLADIRLEMEDLSLREQESSRRRMDLEMQVEELSAVRQTLQADLETSIRRIADLQAALEEVESSDESDTESYTSLCRFTELIRHWEKYQRDLLWKHLYVFGTPLEARVHSVHRTEQLFSFAKILACFKDRLSHRPLAALCLASLESKHKENRNWSDRWLSCCFSNHFQLIRLCASASRSCSQDLEEDSKEQGGGLGRASSSTALSELLEGLRKKRAGWDRGSEAGEGSTTSLPIYQTTGASTLRRRASTLSVGADESMEGPSEAPVVRPGILKPSSPLLPRVSSLCSLTDASPATTSTAPVTSTSVAKMTRFGSCDSLTSVSSAIGSRRPLTNPSIPEEGEEEHRVPKTLPSSSSYQPIHRRLIGGLTAEGGESDLGAEPLVFQNRRLIGSLGSEKSRGLQAYTSDASSDILPAIRRAESTSSLASSSRGGTRRALSVHFGDLPKSRSSRRESDSDSSSSGGSQRRGPQGERLEAEGSEGDVTSVMKKYLKKSEVD
uniref:Myosin motor domain-containing protein n=1 Tax=Denticeps clupeoides TaxID=299321 RepID=A0AAY4B5N5_9TELE